MKDPILKRLTALADLLAQDPAQAPVAAEIKQLASALADRLEQVELDQRGLADQLALAGRLVEVGTMAAAVFHEMNQPLLGIKGFAELVQENIATGSPEKIAIWAQEIRKQVERVQQMQRQVASFLRAEPATNGGVTDLSAAIREAASLFQGRFAKKKIKLEVSVAQGLPAPAIDQQHLIQILVNLLGNALDALESVPERSLRVVAQAIEAGRRLQILVADSGPGICAADRGRLFEPFFTTKAQGGSGLGLYISRRLAEQTGGSLALAEPASLGWPIAPATVFELRLPAVRAPDPASSTTQPALAPSPAPQPAPPPAPPKARQADPLGELERSLREYNRTLEVSQRILLVDDDPDAQQELTETLAQHGLLADVATSGEEALERVTERKYALLLAGLTLPDMDGIELMQAAHRLRPAMEAIICTRSSSLDEVLRAFDRGASDYLPKPYPSRPFISWKVRGALARYDFEVRAQAFIQFLKSSCEQQATNQGHDLQAACVVPLKAALQSFQEDPGPMRIAMAAPVALVRVARKLGYETTPAQGLGELLDQVKQGSAQVVVAVEEKGGIDGVELLTRIWRLNPDTGVFVIAPEKKLQTLVQAIGTGIGDTLLRPLEGRELFAPRLGRLVVRQQRVVRYQRLLSALKSLNLDLMDSPKQPTD